MASKAAALLYRFGIIYVKCMLLSGVLVLGAYLSTADPQTETFGSFLTFLQERWLTLAVALSIPLSILMCLLLLAERHKASLHKAMQEADSCGGK